MRVIPKIRGLGTLQAAMSKSPTPKRPSSGGGTPAILALERAGVPFVIHQFDHPATTGDIGYGKAAANALGVDESRVFKTLLVEISDSGSGSPRHAVGIVPVSGSLSLKAMAIAVGAKRADMMAPAVAERLTGYVVGGISPFGQKKSSITVIDVSATAHPTIFVSGGKRGLDIEIAGADLILVLDAISAPIVA
jgi:Cys-tRNA(Pro)/Cys-tRNA(Cys) deacylase